MDRINDGEGWQSWRNQPRIEKLNVKELLNFMASLDSVGVEFVDLIFIEKEGQDTSLGLGFKKAYLSAEALAEEEEMERMNTKNTPPVPLMPSKILTDKEIEDLLKNSL